MAMRNTKSKRQAADEETADPLGWVALIVAAVLALVVAIQSTPSVRGMSDQPVEAASD
jgi:hypothetical protein